MAAFIVFNLMVLLCCFNTALGMMCPNSSFTVRIKGCYLLDKSSVAYTNAASICQQYANSQLFAGLSVDDFYEMTSSNVAAGQTDIWLGVSYNRMSNNFTLANGAASKMPPYPWATCEANAFGGNSSVNPLFDSACPTTNTFTSQNQICIKLKRNDTQESGFLLYASLCDSTGISVCRAPAGGYPDPSITTVVLATTVADNSNNGTDSSGSVSIEKGRSLVFGMFLCIWIFTNRMIL